MTETQINIALKHLRDQIKRFGYKKPNVRFIHDYIEHMDRYFEEESIDVVVSNCVLNLLEDKEAILVKIYKVLKFGGEFYFSDIYCDRRLPDHVRENRVLYGECLGGALYYRDFLRMARKAGFLDPREVSRREVSIKDPEIKRLIGNARFYSITYRLWKLKGLEDTCEDYGHIAIYKGGQKENEFRFMLDSTHVFEKNKPERICGNTEKMLSQTRFKKYFEIIGDYSEHFGAFEECSTALKENFNRNGTYIQKGCC